MTAPAASDPDWQARVDATWARLDAMPPAAFVAAIDALAAEHGEDDAAGLFERAAARDSTGVEDEAEALYRRALAGGRLDPFRQLRARLQLASTLRLRGRLDESESLLRTELDRREQAGGEHPLHDELRALLALTCVAQDRGAEAAGLALLALAPHLTRYRTSMARQAEALLARTGSSRAPVATMRPSAADVVPGGGRKR